MATFLCVVLLFGVVVSSEDTVICVFLPAVIETEKKTRHVRVVQTEKKKKTPSAHQKKPARQSYTAIPGIYN